MPGKMWLVAALPYYSVSKYMDEFREEEIDDSISSEIETLMRNNGTIRCVHTRSCRIDTCVPFKAQSGCVPKSVFERTKNRIKHELALLKSGDI